MGPNADLTLLKTDSGVRLMACPPSPGRHPPALGDPPARMTHLSTTTPAILFAALASLSPAVADAGREPSAAAGQLSASPASQSPPAAPATGESLVKSDLVAFDKALEPGKPFALGVRFRIAPRWHLYWKNPGDSGGPPGIVLTAPKGFTVGSVEYPRPLLIEHPNDVTIGYETEVIYRVMITPPASFDGLPATVTIGAKLDWMVCSNVCLMGRRTNSIDLPTRGPVAADQLASPGEFPKPAADLGIEASLDGMTLKVRASKLVKGASLRFIPDSTPGVSYGATVPPAATAGDAGASLSIALTVKPQNALGERLRAAGLVILTAADGSSLGSAEVDCGIEAVSATPKPATKP